MKYLLLFTFIIFNQAFACDLDKATLRAPVWYKGQVKSFQVASYFSVKHLFKKVSITEAANFYCKLVTASKEEIIKDDIYKSSSTDYFKEMLRLPLIFNQANKIKEKTDRDRALTRFEKIRAFREIVNRKEIMVFDKTWKSLISVPNLNETSLKNVLKLGQKEVPDNYIYENIVYEYSIVRYAFFLLVFSFLFLFSPWKNKNIFFNITASLSFVLQIVVIGLRYLYTGRAPITNMYETVLLAGALAMLFGILGLKKNKLLFKFASIFCLGTLGTAYFSSAMIDSQIKNLMPVLRDNFWLSTHVTTIMLGYSTLGISWILANTVLLKRIFNKSVEIKEIDDAITMSLKYGVFFLFFGILLGAIWADYSWGRFWAWDPKETWSLIAFLVYMVLLHGIRGKLIVKNHVHSFIAASFMSILIAWFGVNFILASGLHTYGFSVGGTVFLSSIIILQIFIIFKYSLGRRVS